MALVNVTEAARLAGVSRPTLYRRMDSGTLSFTLDANKERRIDTAELLRVFGKLTDADTPTDGTEKPTDVTVDVTVDADMVVLLKAQLDDARTRELWLREELTKAQELLRQLALPPGKSGVLQKIFHFFYK